MPQLNKGGKYVFGWSKIADDRTVHFPPMVLTEYDLLEEQEIIIFTEQKSQADFVSQIRKCYLHRNCTRYWTIYPN